MPGQVADPLQGALAREVYCLIAEDVRSAADVDDALSWGPGLRWGIVGNMMLNHLDGRPGGIEDFQQFLPDDDFVQEPRLPTYPARAMRQG